MGPSFAISFSAWLSAAKSRDPFGPSVQLGCLENVYYLWNGRFADEHPPDLLRLHISIGVCDALAMRGVPGAQEWVAQLEELATIARGGVSSIGAYEINQAATMLEYPILRQYDSRNPIYQARVVGYFIATARLPALNRMAIIDIEDWSEEDQTRAAEARQLALRGPFAAGRVHANLTSAHLLAGATMALFEHPASYDVLTKFLNKAFEAGFSSTPYTDVT